MIRTNTKIRISIRLSLIFSFLCAFILLATSIALAQEQVTITTYYPAPYGIYKELRADQMAVGSAYRASALADGNLLVSGNVGIGTTTPHGRLEVYGTNANAWVYFVGNANTVPNPSSAVNTGFMTAWNPSGGAGETEILYGTGLGSGPRLEFGRWNGTTKTIDMVLKNGSLAVTGGNDVVAGAGGTRPTTARFYSSAGNPGVVEVGEIWFCGDYN